VLVKQKVIKFKKGDPDWNAVERDEENRTMTLRNKHTDEEIICSIISITTSGLYELEIQKSYKPNKTKRI